MTEATYIGKCEGCGHTYRWDAPAGVQVTDPACRPHCDCLITNETPVARLAQTDRELGFLYWINFKPLVGTYRAGVRCTARCHKATSATCECECGGANHGQVHNNLEME
jgi:hypothetical protein